MPTSKTKRGIKKNRSALSVNGFVTAITDAGSASENQDYVVYDSLQNLKNKPKFIVVADGIGSSANAGRAAEIVAKTFASGLRAILGGEQQTMAVLEHKILRLYNQAVTELQQESGTQASVYNELATTVAVVIEFKGHFIYTYVGNGGIYLSRLDDRIKNRLLYYSLLSPQEAGRETACLSPQGCSHRPMLGWICRSPGDLILIGTDGIFATNIFDEFYKVKSFRLPAYIFTALRQLPVEKEAFEAWQDNFIHELNNLTNSRGGDFIEDNITLGIMATT